MHPIWNGISARWSLQRRLVRKALETYPFFTDIMHSRLSYSHVVPFSLYVDVWTPSNATKDSKLPVKVWVYGGSNTEGGISDPLYDGCTIADEGAILVSINYRLGPIGFLGLDSAGIYGNQGIQDILLALEWVQSNIATFGGDTVCSNIDSN